MKTSKSFHHRNLKQALHDAALLLLDRDGIAAVTIRAVAREVGVSHAAPVNHYKDRKALLTALAAGQFQDILASAKGQLEQTGINQAQRVEIIPRALLEYGLTYPRRYQLLWQHEVIDYQDQGITEVTDSLYNALCDEIEAAIPTAQFDRDTVAIALWSMVHGYVDMRISGMFLEKNDGVTGQPRQQAILDLFQSLL